MKARAKSRGPPKGGGKRRQSPDARKGAHLGAYGRHLIEEDDIEAVVAVLRSDFLTTGPAVAAFERALAERTGAVHAVAVSSGTAALHLAVLAGGVGPGDLCVVPTMTFAATANAVRFAGGEVVFADVDPDTGLMRPEDFDDALRKAGRRRVRAVLPVHLGGQTVDLPAIAAIAEVKDITVIEDASHALGSVITWPEGARTPVGSYAHGGMSVFSTHPVKTITMGEGGAITTASPDFTRRLRLLRTHGITRDPGEFRATANALDPAGRPYPWYGQMIELGFNYRASDIHCALGLSQLSKMDRFVQVRRRLRARYRDGLARLAPRVRPVPEVAHCMPAWHLMVALVDFAGLHRTRGDVMRALAERGIGTQVHYLPVHHHPYYRDRYGELKLPGADRYYERCLSLPLHAGMTKSDVDHVVAALAEVLGLGGEA
jgi:UDP-4-amino-4,6-dideoxy-N-acetyl-beta-L-altrosamine transaminase